MRFLILYWCLNNFITYNYMCDATIFDKRKTKLKTRHEGGINSLIDFKSHVPLKTQRNIITKILYQLKKSNRQQLPHGNEENDTSNLAPGPKKEFWVQSVRRSLINKLAKTVYENMHSEAGSGGLTREKGEIERSSNSGIRRDYISHLPRPKVELIDGILKNAVSQIFSNVIPEASTTSNASVAAPSSSDKTTRKNILRNESTPSSNATAVRKRIVTDHIAPLRNVTAITRKVVTNQILPLPNVTTLRKNSLTNQSGKTTKHWYFEKKDVLATPKQDDRLVGVSTYSSSKAVVNDTLLNQIDAAPLDTRPNVVNPPKEVVSSFVKAIDASELNALPHGSSTTPLPSDAERGSIENEENTKKVNGENGDKNVYYFFANDKEALTNEVDDDDVSNDDPVPAMKEVQRSAEKHALNLFQEENNAYRKHRVTPMEESRPRQSENEDSGEDYGMLFVKDTHHVKQLNFYNTDLHLAATVNSSESRLNLMKAVATVLKELGGLTFEEEDEGVVSKAQFDKLMVDADEEDEPSVRSGDKGKRPNIPPNERQIRITKFNDYTAPYISHVDGGYDTENPLSPRHIRPRKLRFGEYEGDDKDEDAINYYQKNKARDKADSGSEERERLIPVGPLTDIDTKAKVAAYREKGNVLNIKGIRKVDKSSAVKGETRELPDIKTDDSTIPAEIHVSMDQLDDPKSFEKIFADRVLLAPIKNKNEQATKKGVIESSLRGAGIRHRVKAKPRVISQGNNRRNATRITNDEVDASNEKQNLFFYKANVNSDSRYGGTVKAANKINDADGVGERTRHENDGGSERSRRMCFYKVANSKDGVGNHLHTLRSDMCTIINDLQRKGSRYYDSSAGIKSVIQAISELPKAFSNSSVSARSSATKDNARKRDGKARKKTHIWSRV